MSHECPPGQHWDNELGRCIPNLEDPFYIHKSPVAMAGTDQKVKPKVTVTLDGSKSFHPQTPDKKIVKYQWKQILGPTVSLVNPDQSMTTFDTPELTTQVEECPQGQHWDPILKKCVDDDGQQVEDMQLLWDSDTTWANGNAREFTQKDPDDPTLEMRAGEGRLLNIDGQGNGLQSGARGRQYLYKNNYNGLIELQYTPNSTIDNLSLAVRSRHNEGGDCKNRFGKFGAAIHLDSCEWSAEICHNEHEDLDPGNTEITPALENGKEYGIRVAFFDIGSEVYGRLWIDYKDGNNWQQKGQAVCRNPKPSYVDKPSFDERSYFWVRTNGGSPKDVKLRKEKLYELKKTPEILPLTIRPDLLITTVANLEDKLLAFELVVTDNRGLTGTDIVNVTVSNSDLSDNKAPVSNAGPDQNVRPGVNVMLDGGKSFDPDLTDVIKYQWIQTGGPSVQIINADQPQATFKSPNQNNTKLSFQLLIKDPKGQTGSDVVDITVTENPTEPPSKKVKIISFADNDQADGAREGTKSDNTRRESQSDYTCRRRTIQETRYRMD